MVSDREVPPFVHGSGGTPAAAWRARAGREPRPALSLEGFGQVVVVAAHPDDESLGGGGVVATAVARGLDVVLLDLTDGEDSHPHSPTHDRATLAERRRHELYAAAEALGLKADRVMQLHLPDGAVAEHRQQVIARLVDRIDGDRTLVVAPWREDGHPDHEAAGEAAAAACRRTGARLWEYPVWFWHWADPADPRWQDFGAVRLAGRAREAKQRAISAHATQVAPLGDRPGDERLLTPEMLAHFEGPHEHFVDTPGARLPDPTLEDLHGDDRDPWGVDSRWYEQRKRDLSLALLPRPRFARVLELGCSTGALATALAPRCDELVAVDSSDTAVAAAKRRTSNLGHIEVRHLDLPSQWPDGGFDLIVVSELGYFLSPGELDLLVERVEHSLRPDGVVLLVHWRHRVEGWLLDAAAVHRRFAASRLPPLRATYADRDVEMRVHAQDADWPDPQS